ncbi:DUF7002 family protein [Paenibacillus whitsoniae]|uniref:DUF4433 domain-containing protein n=1 Tax=Paenibacillus whitsoniae TaxID=2496558 RepID=A0A3S0CER0_9BACL|nr:hypothetical protein [Paenibacillus whitsoniae]RTE11074.1 hypothetical protein EJQ19_03855 [Paenibacillus whitsoniae]
MSDASKEAIVAAVTKAAGRKTLYHFTRVSNLPAIVRLDTLYASHQAAPGLNGERRETPRTIRLAEEWVTINAHLRIAPSMFAPGVTPEQFRAYLDRHVFFWPTKRDCLKMLETYSRRELGERFAVLACEAAALILAHFDRVKLSKYDSGSSPRYPNSCSYRKTPEMLLPIGQFGKVSANLVPTAPSQIKEVLVEGQVTGMASWVRTVYVDEGDIPLPEEWQAKRTLLRAWTAEP